MSDRLFEQDDWNSQKQTETQKSVEDLVREKISDKKLTEEEVSEILARFQSEREKIEADFNSCKIDLQNETATELYNLAKETLVTTEESSKSQYQELISKMEERCEFLKPQEVQTTENIQELSEEDKIFQSEEFKNLDDKTKEILKQNIAGFKDYLSHYGISIPEGIIDFVEGLKYVDNLESSNFKILKEKILGNLVPFLHLQREFKRFDFKSITFETILSLAYYESVFNPDAEDKSTGSEGLMQVTGNPTKSMSRRPELYRKDIISELVSRNGIGNIKELTKDARRKFENNIVVGDLYLKGLEDYGNTYKSDISIITKNSENIYKLTSNYLREKGITLSKEQFGEVLVLIKNNPDILKSYSVLKDYNGNNDSYSGEVLTHKVYYAVSILCISQLMKKG